MIIKLNSLRKEYKVKIKKGILRDMFVPEYKKVEAVKNATFSIKKGESVALLGPNGAGKTTVMKMLSGLLYPTGGEIEVLEYFPFDRKKDFLMRIGLVMGNRSGLAWDLTPSQNFELFRKVYRISDSDFEERVSSLTKMLEVEDYMETQVRKLSLGERMKMEMVGSLLHNPEVLFLDEPTIGLDVVSKQKIRSFLRTIQKESGVTLLLTSHDMDDVEKVSDRVIVINHGSIIFDNSIQNLLRKYKQKKYITFIFTEAVDEKALLKLGKIIDRKSALSYTLEIESTKQGEVISSALKNLPVDDIDIVHVPLEEIIANMFNAAKNQE